MKCATKITEKHRDVADARLFSVVYFYREIAARPIDLKKRTQFFVDNFFDRSITLDLTGHCHGWVQKGQLGWEHFASGRARDTIWRFKMRLKLSKTFRFEAAHALPTFPEGHKCRRLHGHSFRFDVVVEGDVDPAKGYLIDYGDIKKICDPIVRQLDHFYLNDIEGLSNPTAEMISKWLWDKIKPHLPLLATITVHETCTSACEYAGK